MRQQTEDSRRATAVEPEAGAPLVRGILLERVLSFGPTSFAALFPLQPLNVLIGPNGSGKSNLIEAISLMRAAPADMQAVARRGGGVREWIWKGEPIRDVGGRIDLLFDHPHRDSELWHIIQFGEQQGTFRLQYESVHAEPGTDEQRIYTFREGLKGELLRVGTQPRRERVEAPTNASILTTRRDPEIYPELTFLAEAYSRIRIYRDWTFGSENPLRKPQPTDARNDRLEEDFSNLGLVLNRLRRIPKTRQAILSRLEALYSGLDDFDVSIEGGTVQVFLTEGDHTIPAVRLSDGTLRYLCLLAILCDPKPPPLVCLEEPELGLHPDVLPGLAELLIEASERMQLIVTTHSEVLIDALTPHPESVVVCEKADRQTVLRRLDPGELSEWLERYRLGELWTRGQLGGTRW